MEWSFFSISWLILSSLQLLTCNGEETIRTGESLGANQTITSSNNVFALGLFNPPNSTNRYFGIWYNNIPDQTVVWVANKENPITNSTDGVLTIGKDGNLIVLEGDRNILWSSNVSVSHGNNTVAVLTDTGNLVLRQNNQTIVWRSFDNPSSSFIPGMVLSLNIRTGKSIRFTSWKDVNDPATGLYSLGIDPRTPRQIITWSGLGVYVRPSVWQQVAGVDMPEVDRNYVGYTTFVQSDDEISVIATISDNSFMVRYFLTPTGKLQLQSWRDVSKAWAILRSWPENECDLYGRCGPFASCDNSSSPLNICKCLKGFQPRIQEDWDSGNWSGGCVRQKQLECESGDGFLRVARMKLPDFSLSVGDVSARDCELGCLRNCSCTAYAYSNVSRWGSWKCLIWVGDLIDLVENKEGTADLYIRLTRSELGVDVQGTGSSNKKGRVLAIVLSCAAGGMLLLGICGYFLWRRREADKALHADKPLGLKTKYSGFNMLESKVNNPELPLFDFDCIAAATDDFSMANKLGAGGFGAVYRGKLSGQEIAVKRLSKSSVQGLEEFKNEVELIAKLQHRNLVKLLGWCIHGEEKILIYEYMPNNCLAKSLFDPFKQSQLDWGKRFHIIEGIAQGLLYLHRYSRLRVIHRDLKASNILLDGEMNPKISDFGLARIFGGNQTEASTSRVVGTYGYMSPEYALEGHFSEKSDVYSFGVLLLEIVSSRRNTGVYPYKQWLNLLGFAWQLWKEGRALELMDPLISDSLVAHEVDRCIHVGLLCVQEDPNNRPTMSSIVFMLGNGSARPPSPKQPGSSTWKRALAADPSSSDSVSEATISMLEPRT